MFVTVLLLLGALCAHKGHGQESEATQRPGHVSVVIIGATGDLARKYLWQGFFNTYVNQVKGGNTFSFYGGGQSSSDKATPLMFEILKGVSCPKDMSQERCALLKDQFLRLAQYRQLKTLEHYQDLAKHIEKKLQDEAMTETGRLFYLSVPAYAYADIADKINQSCRPTMGGWLRVVLEKPFGHDLMSAEVLASQLASSLKEEEMYRIDHYLGKQVIAKILPFRKENKKFLDPIWNKHHIERVEIVLKETLDVQGRMSFYDQYGVIRDVIQNHLTEVMMLLTMRLPSNLSSSEEVVQNKLRILDSLLPLGKNQVVIGQYQGYNSEVQLELNKTKDHISLTPTFAGIDFATRKIASMLKPRKVIAQDGDCFTIKTFTTFRNYDCSFRTGEEFEEVMSGMDNRSCLTVVKWNNDKLVCVQKGKKKNRGWSHWIQGDELHLELTCEDQVCKQVFKRTV